MKRRKEARDRRAEKEEGGRDIRRKRRDIKIFEAGGTYICVFQKNEKE